MWYALGRADIRNWYRVTCVEIHKEKRYTKSRLKRCMHALASLSTICCDRLKVAWTRCRRRMAIWRSQHPVDCCLIIHLTQFVPATDKDGAPILCRQSSFIYAAPWWTVNELSSMISCKNEVSGLARLYHCSKELTNKRFAELTLHELGVYDGYNVMVVCDIDSLPGGGRGSRNGAFNSYKRPKFPCTCKWAYCIKENRGGDPKNVYMVSRKTFNIHMSKPQGEQEAKQEAEQEAKHTPDSSPLSRSPAGSDREDIDASCAPGVELGEDIYHDHAYGIPSDNDHGPDDHSDHDMGNSSPADFDLEPGSRCCSRSGSESDSDAVSDESDDAGAPAPAPAPASAPAPAPALAHHDVSSDNGDSFEIQLESLRSYVASLLIVHTQDGHTHSSTIRCIRVAVTDGFGKRWPLLLQHWQQVWKTKFETYEGIAEFSGLGKNFKPEAYDCCVNGCIVYQKVHMHKCATRGLDIYSNIYYVPPKLRREINARIAHSLIVMRHGMKKMV